MTTEKFKVIGKKEGQLVEITDMPMSKEDCYKWIKEQGIENHYKDVFPVPYHGSKQILPLSNDPYPHKS